MILKGLQKNSKNISTQPLTVLITGAILHIASTNIYNEKYEIYKTESNAKGRRDSKE